MPAMWCPECRKNIKVGPNRGEQFCLEHPETNLRPKRSEKERLPGRRGTASYDRAKRIFSTDVCSKRCFFVWVNELREQARPGHQCNSNRLEAHHVLDKSWIERNYPDLPEAEFLNIIFNFKIGVPLCPAAHHLITVHSTYIYFEEVRFEAIELAEEVDALWLDVPLPNGTKRGSMLDKLKSQCPPRPTEVTA